MDFIRLGSCWQCPTCGNLNEDMQNPGDWCVYPSQEELDAATEMPAGRQLTCEACNDVWEILADDD